MPCMHVCAVLLGPVYCPLPLSQTHLCIRFRWIITRAMRRTLASSTVATALSGNDSLTSAHSMQQVSSGCAYSIKDADCNACKSTEHLSLQMSDSRSTRLVVLLSPADHNGALQVVTPPFIGVAA